MTDFPNPLHAFSVGLFRRVSLGHILVWAPAIYALNRFHDEKNFPSAYGIWAGLRVMFDSLSLTFDVRKAFVWRSANLS